MERRETNALPPKLLPRPRYSLKGNNSMPPDVPPSLNQLARLLQQTIATGDVKQSEILVAKLAERHAKVEIVIDGDISIQSVAGPNSYLFDIWLEDIKGSAHHPFVLRLVLSTTVAQLKRHFLIHYGFSKSIQRWVINQKMAKDDECLADLLDTPVFNGQPLFLYLQTTKETPIPISKEQAAENNVIAMESSLCDHKNDDVVVDNFVIVNQSGPKPLSRRYGIQRKTDSLPRSAAPPTTTPTIDFGVEALNLSALVVEKQVKNEWSCKTCTFKNTSLRQTCEMCESRRIWDFSSSSASERRCVIQQEKDFEDPMENGDVHSSSGSLDFSEEDFFAGMSELRAASLREHLNNVSMNYENRNEEEDKTVGIATNITTTDPDDDPDNLILFETWKPLSLGIDMGATASAIHDNNHPLSLLKP